MMKTIVVVLVLNAAKLTSTEEKRMDLSVTDSECGKVYNMPNTVSLEYNGSVVQQTNPCNLQFTNKDYTDMIVCISVQNISISCGSTLEYHNTFIKLAGDPKKIITCSSGADGEWCSKKDTLKVFIVIKKSKRSSPDSVKLRLYKKYLLSAAERFFKSGFNIFLLVLSGGVLFAVVFSIVCCFYLRRRRKRKRRALAQTSMETVSLQTGQIDGTSPIPVAGLQPVSQADSGLAGHNLPHGYNIHPDGGPGYTLPTAPQLMPFSSADENLFNSQQGRKEPSAPPFDPLAPPPSYDQLFR